MRKPFHFIGSLKVAVPLLVSIAGVLAWGTFYEARYGTAAVQRFVYQSWWFQALLVFLAVNLATAAWSRRPWKRKHLPFLLAHLGIILILTGGIIGGRFGVEGRLIIPEGESNDTLQLDKNVLAVHQPNPGIYREFLTPFETAAWDHSPHALFETPVEGGRIQVVVDRYYPNAERGERISPEGDRDNPALRLTLAHAGQEDSIWLFAQDPDRFGARWGDAHVFFLEAGSDPEFRKLLEGKEPARSDRGTVTLEFPSLGLRRQLPVPSRMNQAVPVPGTPYKITFKDYFPDFVLSGKGPVSRSNRPDNPAVSFTLSGPEGTDAHLLFARHPDFARMHGLQQKIPSHVLYSHGAVPALPPNGIAVVRGPDGRLAAALTDGKGKRSKVDPVEIGKSYRHHSLGYDFSVPELFPRAKVEEVFSNLDNEIRNEVIHVVARAGGQVSESWLGLRESVQLPLGRHPVVLEYRPALRKLPFSVRLIDFRKTDYPGTQMAAKFESDVEMTDPGRGLQVKKRISMNNPLKHRGYSLFQSSYLQGPTETTILAVRNDPGTPLVYAGFLIVLAGVTTLFTSRR